MVNDAGGRSWWTALASHADAEQIADGAAHLQAALTRDAGGWPEAVSNRAYLPARQPRRRRNRCPRCSRRGARDPNWRLACPGVYSFFSGNPQPWSSGFARKRLTLGAWSNADPHKNILAAVPLPDRGPRQPMKKGARVAPAPLVFPHRPASRVALRVPERPASGRTAPGTAGQRLTFPPGRRFTPPQDQPLPFFDRFVSV
jgi:hypothetical protein